MAAKLVKPTKRSTASEIAVVADSGMQATVRDFAKALYDEMRPGSTLERAAVAEYIDVECQRLKLRLIREQMERLYALGHVWKLLCRAMFETSTCSGAAASALEAEAKDMVTRWKDGDVAARREILAYGIDVDEAMGQGIADNLASFDEIERQRERLASRSRLLLTDVERAAGFMAKRKFTKISDAEIIG